MTGDSPVQVLLHHLGDGPGHGPLLRGEVLVEVDAQLLLQEVHDELGARHLLVVVLHPGHLPLRRQLPIEVVLRPQTALCETLWQHFMEQTKQSIFLSSLNPLPVGGCSLHSADVCNYV